MHNAFPGAEQVEHAQHGDERARSTLEPERIHGPGNQLTGTDGDG
jgi:hypothetical protein